MVLLLTINNLGLTEENLKAIGLMENNTGKENSMIQMANVSMGIGKMEFE